MTSPELPPADLTLRANFFAAISDLNAKGFGMAGIRGNKILGIEEALIPEFVRDRLAPTELPTIYSAHSTTISLGEGVKNALNIRRVALHMGFAALTRWDILYVGREAMHGFEVTRKVTGNEMPVPPNITPEDRVTGKAARSGLLDQSDAAFDAAVPTTEPSGPWPEAGLVVPEGEQLLELIAHLRQRPGAG